MSFLGLRDDTTTSARQWENMATRSRKFVRLVLVSATGVALTAVLPQALGQGNYPKWAKVAKAAGITPE